MVVASREFQIFAKPIGAACNLACSYCYYLGKQALFPNDVPLRMPEDLLEEYIVQHIQASPGETVSFSWHGGEPTMAGLDFFRKVVSIQRRQRPPGRRIFNGIQTNGLLLDDGWARFLAAEGFGVGLSLDGPRELHDQYRVNKGGKPSHEQVMAAFHLLRRHRVECDILCVVHDQNVQHPHEVYGFFRSIGARYISFLPVVQPAPGSPTGASCSTVPAEAFGAFLCTVFDEWLERDVGRMYVQTFEEAARPALGLDHSLCLFRRTCGDIPVIEHNGDFYSCDHFVDAEHRVGNIRETMLVDLLESEQQRAFGQAKEDSLPRYCRSCEVRPMCNGGCPKDRFIRTPDGEPGLNYLCVGLKRFFIHSRPYLERLAAESRRGQSEVRGLATPGRNDPCPCGSGRKYKKCCLK